MRHRPSSQLYGGSPVSPLPFPVAPDKGGIMARRETLELPVEATAPQQVSPPTSFEPGLPLPGPFATVQVSVDLDSIRFWPGGPPGVSRWDGGVVPDDLVPAIPADMVQHIDVWSHFQGANYPSIARNRPVSFASYVPVIGGLG